MRSGLSRGNAANDAVAHIRSLAGLRPALVAMRFNPDLKAKYDHLIAAGKPAKKAITAIMRKIVVLANALLRDSRKWSRSLP